MLGPDRARELLQRALRFSQADQTEALLQARDVGLTRFARNAIHQHVAELDVTLTVRALVGRRTGQASTNQLDDTALARAVALATAHAQQQPEDPDCPGLPEPQPIRQVQAFDEATADCAPTTRAQAISTVCALAADRQFHAAGALRTGATEIAVANSHGLWAYHPATFADLQIVVAGADGTGWAQGSGWRLHDLAIEALGREAALKAALAQNPRPLEPDEYTVIVDPYVTDDLIGSLNFYGMSARDVQEGGSWMCDRMGTQAFSPLISIWDDGHDPLGAPMPFDVEGMPRQHMRIVDRGVIGSPVYDYATARKEGRASTGHAGLLPEFDFRGPLARHLFMAGGDTPVAQMIAATPKGLYITRFWYPRLVHPRECTITAMTRDGVYVIEDGELAYPVKNMRFTQSYVAALAHVTAVGCELRTLMDEFGGVTRVPALRIEGFRFSSSTP